jgi:hypothetical protein
MSKTCDRCMCIDTEENPIFEIIDECDCIEEYICMMCYVEELDKEANDAEG